jgi:HPt (histidine-containing phosphotransfer) domain-containing protein
MGYVPRSVQCNSDSGVHSAGALVHELHPAEADAPDQFFLREIDGLDSALGLRRVMGMRAFYISMLRSFVHSRRHTVSQIQVALQSQDMKKAEYLSHSLVGISGQIGALRVPYDAQQLEEAISSGSAPELVENLLARLEHSLAEIVNGLDSSLPHSADKS